MPRSRPESMSDRMPENMSNKMPHWRPNTMPGGMLEYMPGNMSAGGGHSKKVVFNMSTVYVCMCISMHKIT